MLEKRHIDVTDRVVGKYVNDELNLYVENEPIGKMTVNEQGKSEYQLNNGYQYRDNKFYQHTDVTTGKDMKYTDCDNKEGWC
ncbi:YusG family protein [Priestia filamentosa]|uniref:YusG family protein n=1 Tax=Priestia filamentosa TaxID=1402861 RepID=UPI000314D9A6|nr:YusG family protein [Priestia filamentosa]MED3724763.1 YusG family protein [Priestia filamentosa]